MDPSLIKMITLASSINIDIAIIKDFHVLNGAGLSYLVLLKGVGNGWN